MLFSELGLSAELLRAIKEQGYQEGRDILAGAQTGTGKTAGFTLPLLQRLQTLDPNGRQNRVRALILVPTRELAAQVGESVQNYGRHLPFRSIVIFGGVSINPQISKLRKGVDIVVLDEADRMLDMGFIHDIRKILKVLPSRRQNLLFSATVSREISQLSKDLLHSPKEIQVARRNTTAERVTQIVHPVDRDRKRELLSHMIGAGNWRQVLVFTRTKHLANRLSKQLIHDGLSATAIHGNKSQGARTRALADFKAGDVRVLVATDIAARGLDIDQLPHVVNYELPNVPEDYIHRIGRTARAGQDGHAVSLVCVDEKKLLTDIERLLKRDIDKVVIPGYEPDTSIRPEPIMNGRNRRPSRGGRSNGQRSGGQRAAPQAWARHGNGQGRRSRRAA